MYRGRFAPSPTGPLHLGSLVASLASYLDARARGGTWLVRMEDLDTPRNVPGAAVHILQTLKRFCLTSDEPVVYQSERLELYRNALEQLRAKGLAYPCTCSRKEVGGVYPGTCRNGVKEPGKPQAWRVRDDNDGDFVILRSDGVFAYQLAVVVDDAEQGITDVVRGADLLDSTPRHLHLQTLLGLPHPNYLHVPVVLNADGQKLSKQNLAPPLSESDPASELRAALRFLGQNAETLHDAIKNWNRDALRA